MAVNVVMKYRYVNILIQAYLDKLIIILVLENYDKQAITGKLFEINCSPSIIDR